MDGPAHQSGTTRRGLVRRRGFSCQVSGDRRTRNLKPDTWNLKPDTMIGYANDE